MAGPSVAAPSFSISGQTPCRHLLLSQSLLFVLPQQIERAAQLLRFALQHLRRRAYSSAASLERKVAILGAAGSIGQPLALLMKLNLLVSSLSLYDIAATPGVTADVSHINTRALVKGFVRDDQLGEALEGADLVIIPAGVPRKPGMTRDDLIKINAGIVKGLCTAITRHYPNVALMRRSCCYRMPSSPPPTP